MPRTFTAKQLRGFDCGVQSSSAAAHAPETVRAYSRCFDDYCEFQRAAGEEPLPFGYVKVSRFYFFIFITRTVPNASSLKKYNAALADAARELEIPFCTDAHRRRLTKLKSGLRKLSVPLVRRSLAMVLQLILQLIAAGGMSSLYALQWCARSMLCNCSMLRQQDHKDDSLLLCSMELLLSRSFTCWVGEGKNQTRGLQPSVVWNDFTFHSPGFWMELYLRAIGADAQPPTRPLFPFIDPVTDRIDWTRAASSKDFVREAQARARMAHMAEEAIARITGHSWRAGGATDQLLAGMPETFIMKQGRWLSDAFRVYFRLSRSVLASLSGRLMQSMVTRTAAYLGEPAATGPTQRMLFC